MFALATTLPLKYMSGEREPIAAARARHARARLQAGVPALLLAMFVLLAAAEARAQPVSIVVPFRGGGEADSIARIVINQTTASAGHRFLIENRPGDDSHFGAEVVAKAEPDGRTLLFAPLANYAAAASLYSNLHYDFPGDFSGVTLIANAPHALLAHPSLPAHTVAAILDLARARPGKLRWASEGKHSLSQLEIELFRQLSGIQVASVPYAVSSDALPQLVTGNADLLFAAIAAALPHVKAGRLRAIAVASAHRSPTLPDLPTVAESGVKGFEAEYWFAVLAPAGIDKAVAARLADELGKAAIATEVHERLQHYGIETRASTPAELDRILRAETAQWAKVVKAAR